jgi:hypothetical protein
MKQHGRAYRAAERTIEGISPVIVGVVAGLDWYMYHSVMTAIMTGLTVLAVCYLIVLAWPERKKSG